MCHFGCTSESYSFGMPSCSVVRCVEFVTIHAVSSTFPYVNDVFSRRYYFPTYEDDNLLCVLDVDDDDNSEGRPVEGDRNKETVVIAEDVLVHDSILAQKDVRMKIIMS